MKNNDEIILDTPNAFITSYPHHACFMTIIGNNDNYIESIIAAYIPLAFDKVRNRLDFSIGIDIVEFMESLPFITGQYVTRSEIQKISYINYFKNALNEQKYIYLLIDHFYIKASSQFYKKKHMYHDALIYGYSNKEKCFYFKDFLHGKKYESYKIDFDNMELACNIFKEKDWLRGLKILKIKSAIHEELEFRPEEIRNELEKYLNGIESGYATFNDIRRRLNKSDYCYGIKIYEAIIDECIRCRKSNVTLDIRIFQVLFDHKKILEYMAKKLSKRNKLNDFFSISLDCKKLLNMAIRLRNLSIYYNYFDGKEAIKEEKFNRILQLINIMKEQEKKTIYSFMSNVLNESYFTDIKQKKEIFYYDTDVENKFEWIEIKDNKGIYTKEKGAYVETIFWGKEFSVIMNEKYFQKNDFIIEIDCLKIENNNMEKSKNEIIIKYSCESLGYHKIKIICVGEICSIKCIHSKYCIDVERKKKVDECRFVGFDENTRGDWKHKYGNQGYYIIGDEFKIPCNLTMSCIRFSGERLLIWDTKSIDKRALSRCSKDNRIMAYKENENEFEINLILPGNKLYNISFYFVDYEMWDLELKVEVWSKNKKRKFIELNVGNVSEGKYATFLLKGDLIFKIIKIKGRLATVSGVFFNG
ncbi:hypothetical protein [Clostridium sp. E02]|uniref:hypothetical protein n=1 Tax=Clostridium sp. E02 TaxID=2487134 RepID=UPI000F5225CA|nr:hypothetical protein [Clostridium sp. E02]